MIFKYIGLEGTDLQTFFFFPWENLYPCIYIYAFWEKTQILVFFSFRQIKESKQVILHASSGKKKSAQAGVGGNIDSSGKVEDSPSGSP